MSQSMDFHDEHLQQLLIRQLLARFLAGSLVNSRARFRISNCNERQQCWDRGPRINAGPGTRHLSGRAIPTQRVIWRGAQRNLIAAILGCGSCRRKSAGVYGMTRIRAWGCSLVLSCISLKRNLFFPAPLSFPLAWRWRNPGLELFVGAIMYFRQSFPSPPCFFL